MSLTDAQRILGPGAQDGRLVHLRSRPARKAVVADWPAWLHPDIRAALARAGVVAPWAHQSQAAALAWAGQHVVVATGTASGKSLAYLLPTLGAIIRGRGERGQRGATTLYLAPTKALAHDQLASMSALRLPGLGAATVDGDTPPEEREWARDHAEYVLTNPDLLHHHLLPAHQRWARFLGALRYVVVDECHHYRGVFGAHVAQVLRRLRRLCDRYGANPTFVLASATVAMPELTASRLTGVPVLAVTEDSAPRGPSTLALWEPAWEARPGATGQGGPPARRSALAESAELLAGLVEQGVRTLVFVRSRAGAEALAGAARRRLTPEHPALAARVATYRGGYLPEERRDLEAALREGRILGLAATTALELGIDIAGLDAVILAGFPGSLAGMWQQLGRAGRRGRTSLGVLVARDDPLDTFLVHHPERLLDVPVEATVVDPDNPYVLGPHLCAAAAELPLTESDFDLFGVNSAGAVEALASAGLLRRRPHGWYWTDRRRASDLADLRSAGGAPLQLVEQGSGRVLGTVDPARAPSTAHEGAVYLHQGETFVVRSLDLVGGAATLVRARADYTTTARELTELRVEKESSRVDWPSAVVHLGEVDVRTQVVSYLRRAVGDGAVLGESPLDLPEHRLHTSAVWFTMPQSRLEGTPLAGNRLGGAVHAVEHAALALLPVFATCDRWDIGAVSLSGPVADTEDEVSLFVYDRHAGGAGFAKRGFDAATVWLESTSQAISSCDCETGCPSCVQSPTCGTANQPLDKAGAVILLDVLLGRAPGGGCDTRLAAPNSEV